MSPSAKLDSTRLTAGSAGARSVSNLRPRVNPL